MARISAYPRDLDVVDNDSWIGTSVPGLQTRNFTAAAVAKYLNIKGKISIAAQMVFRFKVTNATAGDFTGPADNSTFASITTMQLSITDKSGQNVVGFMDYLVGNDILINTQNAISSFGHYTIDSYTANGNFYTLNLTNKKGVGSIVNEVFYDFSVFTLASQGAPTFIFNQVAASNQWNITHNLGKFPSITVIDTGDTVVSGEYIYDNNNQVTLNFSVPFSGKAFLN